ncbi:unnamed protein product, partial [Ectocarpus sp. 12 AP-2014]
AVPPHHSATQLREEPRVQWAHGGSRDGHNQQDPEHGEESRGPGVLPGGGCLRLHQGHLQERRFALHGGWQHAGAQPSGVRARLGQSGGPDQQRRGRS